MKLEKLVVRAGGEIVATPECEVFENLAEALSFFDGDDGEETVTLKLLNEIHATKVGNKARAAATKPTAEQRKALKTLMQPETMKAFLAWEASQKK